MTHGRLVVVCLLAVMAMALFAPPAEAQVLYGSIVGNVKDPSNAAVAGATVTVTHKESSLSRQTVTNDLGGFTIPTLPAGTYDVRVTKEGFAAFSQSTVVVTINTVTRVDVGLKVGAVTETVTVTSAVATLQTDRSEVRSEISSRVMQNLPTPMGRNYQQLFLTLPGFRPPDNAHSVPTNPSRALTFNVNGASRSINNTRLDGASSTSVWLPHIVGYIPTLDAVETVNVVTNSFDAEQGLAGGAAINLQTKSGTNALHGSWFHYHTNQHLKAKRFFLPQGQRNPKLVFNEFGGTFGGPIKKDKLFYFLSYEGNFDRENASRFVTVPTSAIKRGDMSASDRDIYDPLTGTTAGAGRTPFDNKQVPLIRQSSIARTLAGLTPLPTEPGLVNNYFATAPYLFDRHRADSKVNWNINERANIFGRWSRLRYDMYNQQVFGDALGGVEISGQGGNPGYGRGDTYSLTLAGTYTLTPNFIIDANYGYTRMDTQIEQPLLDQKIGLDVLKIPGTNGPRKFEGGWPGFSVAGYAGLGIDNNFMPYYRRDPVYQYVVNFNWTKRAHNIRFGMDLMRQHMNHTQPEFPGAAGGPQGRFNFGGGPTVTTGVSESNYHSYATFLLGLVTRNGRILQVDDEYSTRAWLDSFYIRDQWTVSPKLSMSFGLRWEYFPFPTRAKTGLEFYDPATNKMSVCGFGVVPRGCGVEESKKLFAPRFGLAYRATSTFVLRAGYGITYDPFSLARPMRTNYPMLLTLQVDPINAFQFTSRLEEGIPAIRVPDLGNGIIDIPGRLAVFTVPKKFDRGYIQSWNFTMQKQMRWGFVGQAGYVATRQVRAQGWLNINAGQIIGQGQRGQPLNQQFGRTAETTLAGPMGSSHYDSLQASLERRFYQGLHLSVNYTWSKSIGVADNSDSGPRGTAALRYFDLNRTVMGYDRPHNLQISNIWQLPFGKGQRWASGGGPVSYIAGGWQVNSIMSFVSGTPFHVTAAGTTIDMPGSTQTADLIVTEVKKTGGVGRGQSYFDPLAFATPPAGRFGNLGYNSLRGPGIVNWDFGVFRQFQVTERWKVEFRMESFNFSNTPKFPNPGNFVGNLQRNPDGSIRLLNGFTEILNENTGGWGREGLDGRVFRFGMKLNF